MSNSAEGAISSQPIDIILLQQKLLDQVLLSVGESSKLLIGFNDRKGDF